MATVLLATAILAPGAQAYSQSYQALAESPVRMTAVAADPTTGIIYAQENEGNAFFKYDPRTNAWTELAEGPLYSGNNGGATYLGGQIYIAYTGNEEKIAVYNIALNSWSTLPNPLEEGTGNITSGNGKIYMAVFRHFVSYDPATNVTTQLGEPPEFVAAGTDDGFESWGGLQFDGSVIYGHQGNGRNGFGVYTFASNSWAELPIVPRVTGFDEEGPVLGSALDPVTDTYLAYGPYAGEILWRYDIESNSWTTSKIPFALAEKVNDGGMAYVSQPGIEGVYMVQGQQGTEFIRYDEKNVTDLSPSMSVTSVVPTKTGGEVTYSIGVKNNGPERASGVNLADTLPAGTTFVSAASSAGSCSGTSTVSCTFDSLAAGAGASVTLKATAAPGPVSNTATVSSEAIDTNSANDHATATVTVAALAATPAPCKVPKLKGKKTKAAKKALKKAHCAPGKVKHVFSGKVKKGRVVKAGKPGKSFAGGTKIKLVVSKGTKPKKGSHKS